MVLCTVLRPFPVMVVQSPQEGDVSLRAEHESWKRLRNFGSRCLHSKVMVNNTAYCARNRVLTKWWSNKAFVFVPVNKVVPRFPLGAPSLVDAIAQGRPHSTLLDVVRFMRFIVVLHASLRSVSVRPTRRTRLVTERGRLAGRTSRQALGLWGNFLVLKS